MNEADLIRQLEETKEKLNRTLRRTEGLRMKSKILEQQYEDARERELRSDDLVKELLQRQYEQNVMLNRAHIMLNRAHEAMALASVEVNEMAKALPEPKQAEWSDRVSRINDLFKKTGMQDGDLLGLDSPETPSLKTDEIKREGEQQFSRSEAIWSREEPHTPQAVHAELMPEDDPTDNPLTPTEPDPEPAVIDQAAAREAALEAAAEPQSVPQRRTWWGRIVSGE